MSERNSLLERLRLIIRYLRRSGRTRVLNEAWRVFLLLATAVAIDLAFPSRPAPNLPVLEPGMVASEDIIAERGFPVLKSEADLARERAEAAGAVPPIFDHHPAVADTALTRARRFFESIEEVLQDTMPDREREAAVRHVLSEYRLSASEGQLALLLEPGSRQRLAAAVTWALGTQLRQGAVHSAEMGATSAGGVILRSGSREVLVPRDSVTTMQQLYDRAASSVPQELTVPGLQLFQRLLIRFASATIQRNRAATEAARTDARQAVDPVKYQVLKGERIVAAHDRVGPEQMERLRAYRNALAEGGLTESGARLGIHAGGILFNLLLLLIFGLTLRFFRREVYDSNRSLTLVWLVLVAVVGTGALIAHTEAPAELIPVAFAALVVAALFDGLLALLTVFVLSALIVGHSPLLSMSVLFFTLIGGSAAALGGRVVRRRAQTWSLAAVIAAAYLLAAASITLILQESALSMAVSSGWGIVNAVGSTVLAMAILPIAETFTDITTDQTLLELADLNRPVLRRLSLEAPGTYAHSINVANLAEAAAREIGANALLVRVGVYYHDIGKLKKPQYFVENQPRGRNPHDKLKPGTSASIVREHVVGGLEMAEEAGLPEVVKAFIAEHHGRQRIGFFWERAKELAPDADLDIDEFRYSGPLPRSKETAIVLLADSVESAARALGDPTPEKIAETVDRIVSAKLDDGQLDRAPLTLRELSTIKEQFVKVLTGMYHHRIDYPEAAIEAEEKPEQPVVPRGAP